MALSNHTVHVVQVFGSNADSKNAVEKHVSKGVLSNTNLPLKLACALGEEIISAIHVYHAVFEDTLPLVFHASDLVVSAEDNVTFTRTALIGVIIISSIRIIEIAIYSFIICLRR